MQPNLICTVRISELGFRVQGLGFGIGYGGISSAPPTNRSRESHLKVTGVDGVSDLGHNRRRNLPFDERIEVEALEPFAALHIVGSALEISEPLGPGLVFSV